MNSMSALFQSRTRHIGLIVPQVVVREKHTDSIEITSHPVQAGANISDHAWVKPGEVIIDCSFSSGGSLLDFADTAAYGITVGLNPTEVYQQLLNLQKSCEPFEVVTSKRTYSNMLMRQIEVTTDKTTQHILACSLTLIEVLFSSTENIPTAEKSAMKNGVSTAPTQNGGTKTTLPAGTVTVFPFNDTQA